MGTSYSNELEQRLIPYLEDILNELEIEYEECGDGFCFPCPIHEGDNPSGSIIYSSGIFRCWTHSCNEEYRGLLGFIRGTLKKSFREAVIWAENFLKGDRQETSPLISLENERKEKIKYEITREEVRKRLEIPSPYFIKRGFSEEILDKFDIGDCRTEGRKMRERAIVPIYRNKLCVGCLGRTLNQICSKCGRYHLGDCFSNPIPKWKNDFDSSRYLFNYEEASQSESIIVTEGVGEVLRLASCGVTNAVALFGVNLSERQADLLFSSNARKIFLLLDRDEAGKVFRQKLIKKLSNFYKIENIEVPPPFKDVGEMNNKDVMDLLNKVI